MIALGLLSGQGYDALLGPAWTWTIVLVIDGFVSFSYSGEVDDDGRAGEPGEAGRLTSRARPGPALPTVDSRS